MSAPSRPEAFPPGQQRGTSSPPAISVSRVSEIEPALPVLRSRGGTRTAIRKCIQPACAPQSYTILCQPYLKKRF